MNPEYPDSSGPDQAPGLGLGQGFDQGFDQDQGLGQGPDPGQGLGQELGQDLGLRQAKAALRKRLLIARRQLSTEQRTAASRAIRDAVLSLPETQMAGTVAAYYAVGTEPDTHGLVFALWKRGTYVLLPVLRPDGDLDWASYEGPDSLAGPARAGSSSPLSRCAASPPSPALTWSWSRPSRWTGWAAGSAVAVARTTVR